MLDVIRNLEKVDEKSEIFLDNKIISWKEIFEVYDKDKDKWSKKFKVHCHLYRKNKQGNFDFRLSSGECNDGGRFTAVNQAINQAKEFITICKKYNWG